MMEELSHLSPEQRRLSLRVLYPDPDDSFEEKEANYNAWRAYIKAHPIPAHPSFRTWRWWRADEVRRRLRRKR